MSFQTPPPDNYPDVIIHNPEYLRVYLHYVQNGTASLDAHGFAYRHTVNHIASADRQQRAARKSGNLKVLAIVVAGIVALCVAFGIIGAVRPDADTVDPVASDQSTSTVTSPTASPVPSRPSPTPATTSAQPSLPPATSAAPKPGTTIPGDGTFIVGTDITPGTYRTTGPAGINCYWERVSGLGGSFGEIIANGNAKGQTVVTIAASDKGFTSKGCQDWVKVA